MTSEKLRHAQRINLIGTSGSGKSTFARQLAEILSLPYYEMDSLHWKPNWQQASDAEFRQRLEEITATDRWVLDGNYNSRTQDLKWKRVEAIVWLDLPFWQTVARITRRTLNRVLSQQELWTGTGNRESFSKTVFSKDSIIWWSITTHGKNRAKYSLMMKDPSYAHLNFIRLRSAREVASVLKNLGNQL